MRINMSAEVLDPYMAESRRVPIGLRAENYEKMFSQTETALKKILKEGEMIISMQLESINTNDELKDLDKENL